MKRKAKSSIFDALRHRFPTVRLYRTDLEEILELSKERNFNVRISDDDYEYETLDELREQRGERILKLVLNARLEGSHGSVDVEIEKDGLTVRSPKEDLFIPLWHGIKDRIARRVPWYARFMSTSNWLLTFSFWIWIGPKWDKLNTAPSLPLLIWYVVLLLLVGMSIFSFSYNRSNRGIYLQREHEVLGFWGRHGEKIFMVVLGSVLGVLGKIASDMLSGK